MSDTKFTPGPWALNHYVGMCGWSIYAHEAGCIAERWYTNGRSNEENAEMDANANLIAAAPELYEALRYYAECGDGCTCGDGWSHDAARTVIAKAEGRQA